MQTGYWKSDNSIYYLISPSQIQTAVFNAHSVGLKIYPWIASQLTDGEVIDIGTSSLRQNAFNSMVNIVKTYGFDGIADDVEELDYNVMNDYVAYYNGAASAMHAIGKQYFAAIIAYLPPAMGSALFSQIKVDRIQIMLYTYPPDQLTTMFKEHIDFILRYSSSPVGLAIHSDGPFQPLSTSMSWIDQQLATGTPTNKLAGIDIFWVIAMNTNQWNTWSNWNTKN